MKILFKNSIKELHISKNNPTPNTPSVCKIKITNKQDPGKGHSQSQSQNLRQMESTLPCSGQSDRQVHLSLYLSLSQTMGPAAERMCTGSQWAHTHG